jgi:hypothetical protein
MTQIKGVFKLGKEKILAILEGMKTLAKSDFDQLESHEKDDCGDYQEGYLEALNMVSMYFKEKL